MRHTEDTPSVRRVAILVMLIVFTLALVPVVCFGQTGSTRMIREIPRSQYDPGYRPNAQGQQPLGFCSALQKMNPTDKDYGQLIDEARIAVIEQTVEDFYWWSCMILCAALIFTMIYVIWLLKDRYLFLLVTGDIVAQIYNSHVESHAKAIQAIEMHNKLARKYNAKCIELKEALDAAAKSIEKNNRKGDSDSVLKLSSGPNGHASENNQEGSTIQDVPSNPDSKDGDETEIVKEITQAEKLTMRIRALEGQVEAKNQQISNLRTRLNRAHHSLQELRGEAPGESQQ